MFETLKEEVFEANRDLMAHGLVTLTWGNVSGMDRESGIVGIKPSGVSYDRLRPADIVLVDLAGSVVEGDLNPSSDTPTHLLLYERFPEIGGVSHAERHVVPRRMQVPSFEIVGDEEQHVELFLRLQQLLQPRYQNLLVVPVGELAARLDADEPAGAFVHEFDH